MKKSNKIETVKGAILVLLTMIAFGIFLQIKNHYFEPIEEKISQLKKTHVNSSKDKCNLVLIKDNAESKYETNIRKGLALDAHKVMKDQLIENNIPERQHREYIIAHMQYILLIKDDCDIPIQIEDMQRKMTGFKAEVGTHTCSSTMFAKEAHKLMLQRKLFENYKKKEEEIINILLYSVRKDKGFLSFFEKIRHDQNYKDKIVRIFIQMEFREQNKCTDPTVPMREIYKDYFNYASSKKLKQNDQKNHHRE